MVRCRRRPDACGLLLLSQRPEKGDYDRLTAPTGPIERPDAVLWRASGATSRQKGETEEVADAALWFEASGSDDDYETDR